jgi:hypothetical protein
VPEFRCGARIPFSFPARIRTSNKWSAAECLREERVAEHRSELASEGAELIALVRRSDGADREPAAARVEAQTDLSGGSEGNHRNGGAGQRFSV